MESTLKLIFACGVVFDDLVLKERVFSNAIFEREFKVSEVTYSKEFFDKLQSEFLAQGKEEYFTEAEKSEGKKFDRKDYGKNGVFLFVSMQSFNLLPNPLKGGFRK